MTLSQYEIEWNPDEPAGGAELSGIEYPHRDVVAAEKAIDGDWILVLYAKPRTYYRGTILRPGYAAAKFEIYHLTADLGNNLWEAKRLIDFPTRLKKGS